MSFREYLKRRRRTDTPEGDFVEDAAGDRRFPDAMTWEEVEGYLRCHPHAGPEAIQAARNVWRQYVAKGRPASRKAP